MHLEMQDTLPGHHSLDAALHHPSAARPRSHGTIIFAPDSQATANVKQRLRLQHYEPLLLVQHARIEDTMAARGNALASAADEALREAQTQTGHFFNPSRTL